MTAGLPRPRQPAPSDPAAAPRWHGWLFWGLVALHLVPVWGFAYFPTQDGPIHVEQAFLLDHLSDPELPVLGEYYRRGDRWVPNLLGHLVMAAAMRAVPPVVSEKLLLTLYVVLLPVAGRYALQALRPAAGVFAVLVFPFTYNHLLNLGFYNFSLSVVLTLLALGFWLRHHEALRPGQAATLALLALGLYFCHLFGLVVTGIALALLAAWTAGWQAAAVRRRGGGRREALVRALVPGTVLTAAALVPAALLAARFLRGAGRSDWQDPAVLWRSLRRLEVVISHREAVVPLTAGLFWGFAALLLVAGARKLRDRRWERADGLLVLLTALVAIYFWAPKRMGGGWGVNHRLSLFIFLFVILWLGAQPWGRVLRRAVPAAGALAAVLLLAVQVERQRQLSAQLEEYLSVGHLIAPNSVLLPLSFANFGRAEGERRTSDRVQVFIHPAGYLAAERGIVDLANFAAAWPHHPVQWQPEKNPRRALGARLERMPACIEFADYAGGDIDYVLAWHLPADEGNRCTALIRRQLAAHFELVYASPQGGNARLYRRRQPPAGRPELDTGGGL